MPIKKILFQMIGGAVFVLTLCTGSVFASAITDVGGDGSTYDLGGSKFPLGSYDAAPNGDGVIDFGKIVKKDAIDPTTSASEKIQKELGVAYTQAENQRATFYIQYILNRFLAIVGLISLVVLVYGFYKMFFAKDNAEAFQDALSIVKGAIIALIVIGVSRYIVSIIFDVFFAAKEDIQ